MGKIADIYYMCAEKRAWNLDAREACGKDEISFGSLVVFSF
tara:strand:+ start:443 stop:565 length:123 start_codon:yes stop_codon:yes gene_type:complete